MKTRLFSVALVLSAISIRCVAQELRFLQQETDSFGYISHARLSTDTAPRPIIRSAELLKNMYSKRSTDEFKPSEKRKEIRDKQGHSHRYYQQYYRNIKVEYGEATIHSDKQGNIENVFGYFKPVGEVDTEPKLSEKQALEYALKHIGAETYKWQIPEEEQRIKEYYNDTYRPVGELVIVKDRLQTDQVYRLAYCFDIYAHKPMSRNYIWVDAITGDILHMESRIRFTNAIGTAATRYSGSRSITTDSYNGSYRLRETRNGVNISTFDMMHSWAQSSTDFTDNDNNWTTAEHSTNNNDAALDAHWGAEMTYEYFKQVHGRNSWDNKGGPLLSYVNASLWPNSNNAYWDGSSMTYGEGTSLPPYTTLDICAHEIGHGICQETAYLVYEKESGAINESLSDIWAACVENWTTTDKLTWYIGEDLGNIFRIMSNPNASGQPDTYGGTNWWNPSDLTWDNGGVHRNSGVMNYWFYLLSVGGNGTNDFGSGYNVTGIGIDKAAKIVYQAETVYIMPNTNFANTRNHTIAAATNLYGTGSVEVIAVTNAWHAVGVGNKYPPPTITGPSVVCYDGSTFTLSNAPAGTVTWSVTGYFVVSGNGTSATVTRTSMGIGFGTLSASVNGAVVATKTITPCPPSISGSDMVCYAGNTFTLNNAPAGTITWSVTGPFTVSSYYAATARVTRTGTGTGNGTLTATMGGTTIATKIITPCISIIYGSDMVCYDGSIFTIYPVPAGTITWSVTGPFTVSGNGASATVTRTGTGNGNGTLTATMGGLTIATKTIMPCLPPTISGSPTFCWNNLSGFTASNWQPGFKWTISSNLAVAFGQTTGSNPIIVRATRPGWGWVAVMKGTTEIARKDFAVTLDPPELSGISSLLGVNSFHNYERPGFEAELSNNPGHVTYDWYASGTYLSPMDSKIMYIGFIPYQTGPGWVNVSATNACGSDFAELYIYILPDPASYSSVYPNPASNILNIEIDAAALARAKSSAPAITSGKQLKIDPDYDIRLYDNRGTLLRRQKTKGGKVEFSVTDLPDGIYYLHIYDGVSSKPDMRQIVVEH